MSCSLTLQHDGPGTYSPLYPAVPKKDAKKRGKPPQIIGRSLFLLAQPRSPKKCRWFNRTWSFFVPSWDGWTGLKKGNYNYLYMGPLFFGVATTCILPGRLSLASCWKLEFLPHPGAFASEAIFVMISQMEKEVRE